MDLEFHPNTCIVTLSHEELETSRNVLARIAIRESDDGTEICHDVLTTNASGGNADLVGMVMGTMISDALNTLYGFDSPEEQTV